MGMAKYNENVRRDMQGFGPHPPDMPSRHAGDPPTTTRESTPNGVDLLRKDDGWAADVASAGGGRAGRMWPETKTVPKTLLPVHGKPFAAWQLSWLARSGIDSIAYSVGYLGDDVRAYAGDGSAWGGSVVYVDEGEQLRGTAGALRLTLDSGVLEDDFVVLYGDSWL
jgi:hypothetical protein